MEDYKWVKFEGVNKRQEDRITVTGTSAFGFPTKFYRDHGLENQKYVTLYYDAERLAVGLRFHSDDAEPHKYSLLKSKQGFGANAMATSFFKQNKLSAKLYRGRYEYKRREEPGLGEIYVILLKEHAIINSDIKQSKPEEVQPIPTT